MNRNSNPAGNTKIVTRDQSEAVPQASGPHVESAIITDKAEPESFDRLAEKLIHVPKSELDAQRQNA